jgi:cell division protein ZapA
VSEPVEVRLLDKSYLVACPDEEREGLLRAAGLLDERLRQMKARDKSASLERIAVLAALNFAHEKLQADVQASQGQQTLQRLLSDLGPRIDSVLAAVGQR